LYLNKYIIIVCTYAVDHSDKLPLPDKQGHGNGPAAAEYAALFEDVSRAVDLTERTPDSVKIDEEPTYCSIVVVRVFSLPRACWARDICFYLKFPVFHQKMRKMFSRMIVN
jgi:hypothetical protein